MAVGVVATAAILAMTFDRQSGTAVRIETVDQRDLVATVTASGNVRATRKVDISSDISAKVAELLVEEGEDVEEGQILLRLDPDPLPGRAESKRGQPEPGAGPGRAVGGQPAAGHVARPSE